MQIDFGLCTNFTFEMLDSKYILSALQCVISTCKCCGTAGSMINVHYQSSCSRVYFILLISVMRCVIGDSCAFYVRCNGKPRMIAKILCISFDV